MIAIATKKFTHQTRYGAMRAGRGDKYRGINFSVTFEKNTHATERREKILVDARYFAFRSSFWEDTAAEVKARFFGRSPAARIYRAPRSLTVFVPFQWALYETPSQAPKLSRLFLRERRIVVVLPPLTVDTVILATNNELTFHRRIKVRRKFQIRSENIVIVKRISGDFRAALLTCSISARQLQLIEWLARICKFLLFGPRYRKMTDFRRATYAYFLIFSSREDRG